MLQKERRLRRREEIMPVLRGGKPIPLEIGMARLKANQQGYSRACVIVSNAVSKKATVRNTIKRRIREALRKEILPYLHGFDIIIIAKAQAVNAPYSTIVLALTKILKKIPDAVRLRGT